MSDYPLVSIVIPCFNREKEISDAINSALSQTYASIEIIIVDDGSTDNSIEVIKRYGEKVKLIAQPNSGVSAARNTGFELAKGKFIVFLDSDDWLSDDIIEKHISTVNQYPDADIYCADSTSVNSDGELEPISRSSWPDKPDTPLELFLLAPPPFPACELYRADTIKKLGGYDEDMRGFADSGLRLKIVLAGGKVVRTPGGYAVYRPVANSITKNGLKLHYYALKLIKKLKTYPLVKNNPEIQKLIDKRLLRHRLRWWRNVLSHHAKLHPTSLIKFLMHLIKLCRVDPGFLFFLIRDKPWRLSNESIF